MIDEKLLEIRSYEGTGYQPLIDYDNGGWRFYVIKDFRAYFRR